MRNMSFSDDIRNLANKVIEVRDAVSNEEATKMSMIIPFFQLLGYDVSNPREFCPEYTAGVGNTKFEKVDYAIVLENSLEILIECKWCGEELEKHHSQLFKYFCATSAKFAILTNGIQYKFYTDIEKANTMDLVPFLEVDMSDLTEADINSLLRFRKECFDQDMIVDIARKRKYSMRIEEWFKAQMENVTDELVKTVLADVYDSKKTQKTIEEFRPLINEVFSNCITDIVNDRVQKALLPKNETVGEEEKKEHVSKIVTTEEEIQGFNIVRAILAEEVDLHNVYYRDTESYFSVLYNDSNVKPICRLYFNTGKKYIHIPNGAKNANGTKLFEKYLIENLIDIFKYKKQLIQIAKTYENN